MPESRDRLSRADEVAVMFEHLRRSSGGTSILPDEPGMGSGTPFRLGSTATVGTRRVVGMAATQGGGVGRGISGTPRPRNGRGRNLYRTPVVRRENTAAGSVRQSQGRPTNSVLPSWYPRRPLQDITAIVRAIERRRARMRETEDLQIEGPMPQDRDVLDPSVPLSGAQLEHDISVSSPNPVVGIEPGQLPAGKVSKILLDIANQSVDESGYLTPQKQLLNSIDTVEKVVMEELEKLKRTPAAKKVERQKKVRTLMSMR